MRREHLQLVQLRRAGRLAVHPLRNESGECEARIRVVQNLHEEFRYRE